VVEEPKKLVRVVPPVRSLAEQIASSATASIRADMLASVTSMQKSIALSPAVVDSLAVVQKSAASLQQSVGFNPATLSAIKSLQQSVALSPSLTSAISSWGTTGAASVLRGLETSGFNKIWESRAAGLAQAISPLTEMLAKQQADTARLIASALSPLLQMRTEWAETLSSITSSFADLYAGIDFEGIRRRMLLPSNLPTRYEALLPEMKRLLEEEGIPLAWVPRQEIVEALLAATSADERTAILLQHADEILEDCDELVADMDAESLAGVLPIAREVIEGYQAGKRKIAAVAAVTVTNTVVEQNRWATNERSARKHYALSTEVDIREFTLIATLAALIVFYREWHPQAPTSMPDSLARHVVSHNLRDEHLSERNCLVAVMLMTSLLQTVQHEAMRPPPRVA
jgi:hypothetical protein